MEAADEPYPPDQPSSSNRDILIKRSWIDILSDLERCTERNTNVAFIRRVTAMTVKLCLDKNTSPPTQAITQILSTFQHVFENKADSRILTDVVQSIKCLTEDDNIQRVIDARVVPNLIELLSHNESDLKKAALGAIYNIAAGTNEQKQFVLNCNVLSYFQALLSDTDEDLRAETGNILALITEDTQNQRQAVIDAGLLPSIIKNLKNGKFENKKWTVFVISDLIDEFEKDRILHLVQSGTVPAFCVCLVRGDSRLVIVSIIFQSFLLRLRINFLFNSFSGSSQNH